jgi:hypothetical protein
VAKPSHFSPSCINSMNIFFCDIFVFPIQSDEHGFLEGHQVLF